MIELSRYAAIVASRTKSTATTARGIKAAMLKSRPTPNTTPLYARGTPATIYNRGKRPNNNTRLTKFLNSLNPYPYHVSESRWAGGNHETSWRIADRGNCGGGTTKAYSANGKWSGTNSWATLEVTQRAINITKGDLLIGGLITLDMERVGNREYRIVYAAQARGCDINPVRGWLIRGHHVNGGTLEQARKRVAKARKAQLAVALETRADRAQNRRDFGTVFVSVEDSIKAGNCEAGTENMRKRIARLLGGNVGAVRADVLLNLVDDNFTRRAVMYAVHHHG